MNKIRKAIRMRTLDSMRSTHFKYLQTARHFHLYSVADKAPALARRFAAAECSGLRRRSTAEQLVPVTIQWDYYGNL
jgi:hypothetical protein